MPEHNFPRHLILIRRRLAGMAVSRDAVPDTERGNEPKETVTVRFLCFSDLTLSGTYTGFRKVMRHHTLSYGVSGNAVLTTTATLEVFNAGGFRIAVACAEETANRLNI